MATNGLTVTIHMVSSLDGYVARKDNSVSWFDTADNYEKGVTEEDTAAFSEPADCYVMGSRTYEHALELSKLYGWVYGDVPTIVLTHRNIMIDKQHIETFSGNPDKLIAERLQPNYKNVWIVGGPSVAKDFIRLNLADEIRLSIIPILLGDGLPFFNQIDREQVLHLTNTTAYKSGLVELCYQIIK